MGGTLLYGQGGQTSCFLMARDKTHPLGNIWPVALYPLRSCEVVFQHLAARSPFDDIQMREELRVRLNKIPGVDLPASKIELRPSFPLTVLADPAARELFVNVLGWFNREATSLESGPDDSRRRSLIALASSNRWRGRARRAQPGTSRKLC